MTHTSFSSLVFAPRTGPGDMAPVDVMGYFDQLSQQNNGGQGNQGSQNSDQGQAGNNGQGQGGNNGSNQQGGQSGGQGGQGQNNGAADQGGNNQGGNNGQGQGNQGGQAGNDSQQQQGGQNQQGQGQGGNNQQGNQGGTNNNGGGNNQQQQNQQGNNQQGQGQGGNQQQQGGQNQQQGQNNQQGQGQNNGQNNQQGNNQQQQLTPEQIQQQTQAAQRVAQHYIDSGMLMPVKDKQYDYSTQAGFDELFEDTVYNRLAQKLMSMDDSRRQFAIMALNDAPMEDIRKLALQDQQLPDYSQYDPKNKDHRNILFQARAKMDLGENASEDDIRGMVDVYTAMGENQQENVAGATRNQLTAIVNQQRQQIVAESQRQQQVANQQKAQAQQVKIDLIRKAESIMGIPVSPAEREQLVEYMFKPVEAQGGKTARELALNDQNDITLAFLQLNNFDLSKLSGKNRSSVLAAITNMHGAGNNGQQQSAQQQQQDAAAQQQQINQTLQHILDRDGVGQPLRLNS